MACEVDRPKWTTLRRGGAATVVAGEGGDVQSARGLGGRLCSMTPLPWQERARFNKGAAEVRVGHLWRDKWTALSGPLPGGAEQQRGTSRPASL